MIAKRISWLALALLAGCTGDFPSYPADAGGDAAPDALDSLVDAQGDADDGRPPTDADRPAADADPGSDATSPDAGPCSEEKCNGDDDDCDGRIDEGGAALLALLRGRPGIGRCMDGVETCRDGVWVGDCTGAIGPVDEVCNGVDEDCDGRADEAPRPCYDGPPGTEGVGRCAPAPRPAPAGLVRPVRGGRGAREETCDGTDEDCDGHIDEAVDGCDPDPDDDQVLGGEDNCPAVFNPDQADADGDGAGDACDDDDDGDGALDADDCQPFDPTRFPGAAERCDGADDDCDGAVDEGADRACYDGPAGTEGVGACHAGVQRCIDAAYGPCEGARGRWMSAATARTRTATAPSTRACRPAGSMPTATASGTGSSHRSAPPSRAMAVVPGDCDDGDAQVAPGQADPPRRSGASTRTATGSMARPTA
ncbi:MAG: MopE-related protein [bacterium]